MRARTFHTDETGRFNADLACTGDHLDRPSPCAGGRLRDLTVAASAPGHRLQLKSFKLKKLEVYEIYDRCAVEIPDMQLSAER